MMQCANRYNNTDLVVVVTMRPAASDDVSGYAIALQRDTERRATVGLFNWCPNTVKQELYKIEVDEEKLTVRSSLFEKDSEWLYGCSLVVRYY